MRPPGSGLGHAAAFPAVSLDTPSPADPYPIQASGRPCTARDIDLLRYAASGLVQSKDTLPALIAEPLSVIAKHVSVPVHDQRAWPGALAIPEQHAYQRPTTSKYPLVAGRSYRQSTHGLTSDTTMNQTMYTTRDRVMNITFVTPCPSHCTLPQPMNNPLGHRATSDLTPYRGPSRARGLVPSGRRVL